MMTPIHALDREKRKQLLEKIQLSLVAIAAALWSWRLLYIGMLQRLARKKLTMCRRYRHGQKKVDVRYCMCCQYFEI
jgi:hypothetical protein